MAKGMVITAGCSTANPHKSTAGPGFDRLVRVLRPLTGSHCNQSRLVDLHHERRSYGQGITVAALQVEALTAALKVRSGYSSMNLLLCFVDFYMDTSGQPLVHAGAVRKCRPEAPHRSAAGPELDAAEAHFEAGEHVPGCSLARACTPCFTSFCSTPCYEAVLGIMSNSPCAPW